MPANIGLSAPEAFVLISLPLWHAQKALKLGFMGLLAQGVLRVETEDKPGLIRTRHITHLYASPNLPSSLPPISASLVAVVNAAAPTGTMTNLVKQARRAYGSALLGFVRNWVLPSLVARGLVEPYKHRLLGLFPVNAFRRTQAGEAEKARLDGLLLEASQIPGYLDRDPAQATALVAALGGAILLADELRPHYQAIGQAMRQRDATDSGGYTSLGDGGSGTGDHHHGDGGNPPDPGNVEFGNVDFGNVDFANIDFGGIDFSAFDSGAFDSFDAGFSDAGGDGGGGDGGGGDGGSSGC